MDETARGHNHGRFSCGGVTRHTTFIGSFVGVLIIKALKSDTMHHVSCNGRACDPRCSCLLAVDARDGRAVRRRCRAAEGGGRLGCNRQMTALPDHGWAQGSARTDFGLVWMREEAPAASYGLLFCLLFSRHRRRVRLVRILSCFRKTDSGPGPSPRESSRRSRTISRAVSRRRWTCKRDWRSCGPAAGCGSWGRWSSGRMCGSWRSGAGCHPRG